MDIIVSLRPTTYWPYISVGILVVVVHVAIVYVHAPGVVSNRIIGSTSPIEDELQNVSVLEDNRSCKP